MPRSLSGGRLGTAGPGLLISGAAVAGAAVEAHAFPDVATSARRADPPRVYDADADTWADVPPTVIMDAPLGDEGNCRLEPWPAIPRGETATVADHAVTVRSWLLSLSADCPRHAIGDFMTVTTRRGQLPPFVVIEIDDSSTATAQRLLVEHPTGEAPLDE